MKVTTVSFTPGGEALIAFCARVSNPANQDNPEIERLLRYCIKHGHWSVFEMADLTVEIETSRAISAQLLRHRSFVFQEFSQRYADTSELGFEDVRPRRQDTKNRQNSTDDLNDEVAAEFMTNLFHIRNFSRAAYKAALDSSIAKESARFLLPLSTTTRLYMKGNIRSWIHYLQSRLAPETQKEHRDIAELIAVEFKTHFPLIYKAVFENECV